MNAAGEARDDLRAANNKIMPRFTADYLATALESIFKSSVEDISFFPLAGDASTRRYFRVSFHMSRNGGSVILMQLENPVAGNEIDFTLVLKFLSRLELPVPRLFRYDTEKGLLFLEDCGDMTLEEKGKVAGDEEMKRYYRQAVELLATLQDRATKHVEPACPAFHLRFDVEKLMWEFNFMLEHYVRGLKRIPLSEADLQKLRQGFLPLCETLAAQTLHFTHRDYHSRNLMVHGDRLVMLDFQDARMGPCQYDLVSLLRDSYVRLEDGFVEEMLDFFIQLKETREGRAIDRKVFCEIFDLMAVQRNLKAIGTFAYQSVAKKNNRYLESIPRTLGYVRQTLDRRPSLHPLRKTLGTYITELNVDCH